MYGNIDWFFLCHVSNDCNYDLKSFLRNHTVHYDVVSQKNKHNFVRKKEGGFALENSADDVYVLQNGIYRFNGKWKKRGIFIKNGKQFERLYTVILNGTAYMVYHQHKPNTIQASIISGDVSKIAKFETCEKRIDLNADRKRHWLGQKLERIDDETMHVSMPWNLDFL